MPDGPAATETRPTPERSNAHQTEHPSGKIAHIREKIAANRKYRELMKPVIRDTYHWTGFRKDDYDPEQFAQKERNAYKHAYGEEALKKRDETPKKEAQNATETPTTSDQEETAEFIEIRRIMKDHSDEQLQKRLTLGGTGAEVAKKKLAERLHTRIAEDTGQRDQTRQDQVPTGEIPRDKEGLVRLKNIVFDRFSRIPYDQIKDALKPQIQDLYRRYLEQKIKIIIAEKKPSDRYFDTIAQIAGDEIAFVQKLICAITEEKVPQQDLLQAPFSEFADRFGVKLPANYKTHFPSIENADTQPVEEREAA